MSKGYGKRETAIIEAIQSKGDWLYLRITTSTVHKGGVQRIE